MKKKKTSNNSFLYFSGSVLLIIIAIVAIAIFNRTVSEKPQDVRARASVTSLMRLTAIVSAVDETAGTIIINDIQFANSAPENLQGLAAQGGEWTVIALGINLSTLRPGARVELQVNPSSFNIAERNLTASAISVSR